MNCAIISIDLNGCKMKMYSLIDVEYVGVFEVSF